MSVDTKLPLRDFDGESDDDTDSETELLIRHDGNSQNTSTRKLNHSSQQHQQQQRYGSYSAQHNTHYYRHKKAPSFLSQLLGVVGGTTAFSSSSRNDTSFNKQQQPAHLRSTSSITRDGQVRLRNERSRERSQTTTNITASQTINNAAQAAKFGHTSASSSPYNINSTTNPHDSFSAGYSDSFQMSTMEASTQPNITTTTSPANGVTQTVIDPENGSTTVFYQKNRRKSKKRSFGNLCRSCLCG